MMCQCFCTYETVTFSRASQWSDDQNIGDFVYTCFRRSNAKWLIQPQKSIWSFWNLDQYLRLLMEYLLLYDTFVFGSLQVMPQSDCLPVPALTAKPNDLVVTCVNIHMPYLIVWWLRCSLQSHRRNTDENTGTCPHFYVSGNAPGNQGHFHIIPTEDAELALSMEINPSLRWSLQNRFIWKGEGQHAKHTNDTKKLSYNSPRVKQDRRTSSVVDSARAKQT